MKPYLKYFTSSYVLLGLITILKICFLVVIFAASYKAGSDYGTEFTILKTFNSFFAQCVILLVLLSVTVSLSLTSLHFFNNIGRIIDGGFYYVGSASGERFTAKNIPFAVAVDIHNNPTTRLRFFKQTLVFALWFAVSFSISYHLTTVGTSKKLVESVGNDNTVSEKKIKSFEDSSRSAINKYYDKQLNDVRKTTNFNLKIAESKQAQINALLIEKSKQLDYLNLSVKELRAENKLAKDKRNISIGERESRGKIIGGFFEIAVVICSLVIQILNPKDKSREVSSPIEEQMQTIEKTFKPHLNETFANGSNGFNKKTYDFAADNKELIKVLFDRNETEKVGGRQDSSLNDIALRFGLKKSDVSNLYYKIKNNPQYFERFIVKTSIERDEYERSGVMSWNVNN
jgi:hypothetical protein